MSIPSTRPGVAPAPAVQPPARRSRDIADHQWRERAACRNADPELFTLERDDPGTELALSYCARCPVVAECREFAWQNGGQGVWGGTWRPVQVTIRDSRRAAGERGRAA